MTDRLINRRQQGDLGEASAIEWLTRAGAVVSVPFGHSPDYDLLADFDRRPLRVQVKTSVFRYRTKRNDERWHILLATRGGNQSWSGTAKALDPSTVDCLFVLVGNGRRWFIPAPALQGATGLRLGGPRYSEYEIEAGDAIRQLVYEDHDGPLESDSAQGERRSRRAGPVCKIGALALSEFDSHLPHSTALNGPSASTRVSRNHQVTIPRPVFEAARFAPGDRLKIEAHGPGEVLLTRLESQNANGPPDGGPSAPSLLDAS